MPPAGAVPTGGAVIFRSIFLKTLFFVYSNAFFEASLLSCCKVYQIEIDDFLFFGAGGVTGRSRLRRDLRASGSAALIHGRLLQGGLALGLFVPRFGWLGLIGSGLAILWRTTSAGLGDLVLFRG